MTVWTAAGEVTAGLAESNGSLPTAGWMTYSRLRADSVHREQLRPNAHYQLWESLYLLPLFVMMSLLKIPPDLKYVATLPCEMFDTVFD